MVQAHAQQLLNEKNDFLPGTGDKLIAATRRLVAALDRLEQNLQSAPPPPPPAGDDPQQLMFFARENEALLIDRENLNAALAQLQSQYNDLQQAANAVYGKLDASINRLTQMIES